MLKNKDYKNGEKIGEKIGEEKGKKLGKKDSQIEIAKKLLERKMLVEDIQEITLLTKEEIENLK
mgnify:CR=1 FL=1